MAFSGDSERRLTTSVVDGFSGAPAAAKSHFTARGKQAAILTGPEASCRRTGSFRAESSQRSATASNSVSEWQSPLRTASLVVFGTTWAYWQWQ